MESSERAPELPAGHRLGHLAMILGIVLFHIACYRLVNVLTHWVPLARHDYSIFIDAWIPYWGWTACFYYGGDLYVLFGAFLILRKLPHLMFHRAVAVYVLMILAGAVLEFVLAAALTYPIRMIALQQTVHRILWLHPFAGLPSMHVALTLFPTCLAFSVWRSRPIRFGLVLITVLIALSTLTFKEHVVWDVVGGAVLALAFYAAWRRMVIQMEQVPRGAAYAA